MEYAFDISRIHDECFEFLFDKYLEYRREKKDFFFRTRQRFGSGKDRIWFPGNHEYAAISFWTGNDAQYKTPNIYFEVRTDGKCWLKLVAKGTSGKKDLYEGLAQHIDNIVLLEPGVWRKMYTEQHEGRYLEFLQRFIEVDKVRIDQYLDEHKKQFEQEYETSEYEQDDDLEGPQTRPITAAEFYPMLQNILRKKFATEDFYFSDAESDRKLPFCFKKIQVTNYRGIDKLIIEDIASDSKWIVLTGENGFGKSSVLQSIAIGLYGTTDASYKFLDEQGFIVIEGKDHFENYVQLRSGGLEHLVPGAQVSINKNICVYGAMRLNMARDISGQDLGVMYNLFFPNGILINTEQELIDSHAYNRQKFELLKTAFCQLIPDLHDIRIDTVLGKPTVKYIEKDATGQPYQEVSFDQLASGFRNIIGVVGDIIYRLSRFNEAEVLELNNLAGIVIIDEIELHLHPKYQKWFPKVLSELFPSIQFIVSTHSPIPLLGVPKETTLLKVNRQKEGGITVETLEIDFANMLPNQILTSPVFGFTGIVPDAHDGSAFVRAETTFIEMKQNDERRSEIDEFLTESRKEEMLKLLKK